MQFCSDYYYNNCGIKLSLILLICIKCFALIPLKRVFSLNVLFLIKKNAIL